MLNDEKLQSLSGDVAERSRRRRAASHTTRPSSALRSAQELSFGEI